MFANMRLVVVRRMNVFYFFSAGVGRSGCFILIDAMLERIDKERNVDIFNYLRYMRSRRINMVQTFVSSALFCLKSLISLLYCRKLLSSCFFILLKITVFRHKFCRKRVIFASIFSLIVTFLS